MSPPHSSLWPACAALVLVACASEPRRSRPASVTQAELRAHIDRHSCAYWEAEVRQWSALYLDDRCPPPPIRSELDRAVAAAVARVAAILPPLAAGAYDRFYGPLEGKPPPPQAQADALVRASFWADPTLARATLTRAVDELAAHNLRCADCPAPTRPEPLALRWDSFFPYLAAYVWPTENEGKIDIYVCSGTNGVGALEPDPRLQQLGFLTAWGVREPLSPKIREIADPGTSRPLAEVSQQLRELLDSATGRAAACASLAETAWFTGVTVDICQ